MRQEDRKPLRLENFPGLYTNADPEDTEKGAAQVQRNITCTVDGQLTVRGGFRRVAFEN